MHKPFIEQIEFGKTYLLRMVPDDDIAEKILAFCKEKNINRCLIYSAIGSAKDIILRDLISGITIPVESSKINEMRLHGPFEVLSLEGNVFPMDNVLISHLHILLGTENGSVCGGHLFSAKVWSTLEIVLVDIHKSIAERKKSDLTGLNELLTDFDKLNN